VGENAISNIHTVSDKEGEEDERHRILKADRARVKTLFRQYEGTEDQRAQQRQLAEQIFTEIEVHATLEEELFYPALRGQLGQETTEQEIDDETEDGEEDLLAEAMEEHQEVKALIAGLRAMDPGDVEFQAKFAELRESVEEHVGMEEDELMPDAVAVLSSELEPLGRQLERRKEQLMTDKS
jgi:hemerythrin-like domain-containing protein